MKTTLFILLFALLTGSVAWAQSVTGNWEADEVSLEVTSVLKLGILQTKQPHFGTKPARNRLRASFFDDGTMQMNGERGTYQLSGNRLSMEVNGKAEEHTIYRNGDQLQLWGQNVVASQNERERAATAIMMSRQMGMQDSFAFLQPTDNISSVRVGMYLRYIGVGQSAHRNQGQNQSYAAPVNCEVSDDDLARIKEQMESTTFDTEKPKIMKAALTGKRCFRTDQIRELLDLFTFDSDKLPLAKFAYSYVKDRANYSELTEAFDFDNSKDELRAYIRNRR